MIIDFTNAKTRLCKEYKTISGLEITGNWRGWFELYRDDFVNELEKLGFGDEDEFVRLLVEVSQYDNIGEFLVDLEEQRAELVAFGLILLDRILRAESTSTSHEDIFAMHEGLIECRSGIVRRWWKAVDAEINAHRSHSETNQYKREIFEWLSAEKRIFKSADKAATEIVLLVPVAHSTAKKWFKQWKKEASASTVNPLLAGRVFKTPQE